MCEYESQTFKTFYYSKASSFSGIHRYGYVTIVDGNDDMISFELYMPRIEGVVSPNELIDTMHRVTLMQDKTVLPYEHAAISVEEMGVNEFTPTTLYVIKSGLRFQRKLRQDLLLHGHDSLQLDGALLIRSDTGTIGLTPPIVEDDPEYGPCLIDGAHRVYGGRQLGVEAVRVIRIKNALETAPIYAHANTWDEIVEYDETPADPTLKKRYRDNPKSLYRDFSGLNGSSMRGTPKS